MIAFYEIIKVQKVKLREAIQTSVKLHVPEFSGALPDISAVGNGFGIPR